LSASRTPRVTRRLWAAWSWSIRRPSGCTWIIDSCGDHRQPASTELERIFDWEDLLLACNANNDLVQLSSFTDDAARVLATRGCSPVSIADAIVAYDNVNEDVARLVVIHTDGNGDAVVDGLLDDVEAIPLGYLRIVQLVGSTVFAQTLDSAVVRVDPITRETVVEIEAAYAYAVTEGHLLYRPSVVPEDEPGPIVLRDRSTGDEKVIVPAATASSPIWLTEHVAGVTEPGQGPPQYFWTADGTRIVPPAGTTILALMPDAGFWLTSFDERSYVSELFRWREGEQPESLMSCRDCQPYAYADGLHVLVGSSWTNQELWFADHEAGPARLLAERFSGPYLKLADDRVLSVIDEVDEYATLIIHDPVHGARPMDAFVRTSSLLFTSFYALDGELLYEVNDPDGRHALLRARLAP